MRYILLAAGQGTRLAPITLSNAKSLFKLDETTTLIERTVQMISENDKEAEILLVVGYKHKLFEEKLQSVQNIRFVYNPFYKVTNSIASLWFAKEYLKGTSNIVIMNADVLVSEKLMQEIICKPVDKPTVLLDSSIKTNGDYNVQVNNERVLVMSKELKEYFGEYAGVTKLNKDGVKRLYQEIETMVEEGQYDQWYENALVRAIFADDFNLYYADICDYEWTELDDVNDLVYAKQIYDRRNDKCL